MIARISNPGSFLAGAVNYNTVKVELGGGELIATKNFGLEDGTNLDVVTANHLMLAQLQLNSRIEKGVFSCNLNPNLEDLSNMESLLKKNNCATKDELYDKMAAQYMQGMGYGNQPYLVFRHNDIDREHIHIVSIRVDEKGNRINNFNEHLRSERVRNEVNQSLGLSTKGELKGSELSISQQKSLAENRYGFMERTKKAISDYNEAVKNHSELAAPSKKDLTLKEHQTNLFHHVSNALKYVNENYNPKDLKEYNKILSQFNIVCKKNEGNTTDGKRFSGCQYAVLGENGDICSHLMKGSSFGKAYGLNGLEKRFALANEKKSILENADFSRKYITSAIDAVMKAPVKLDFEVLSAHLKERGISTLLVKSLDDPSLVRGVNFIDNINGATFNGNNLGKAYSYNRLCKSIEEHNRTIEREDSKHRSEQQKSSFVPSEQYREALKLLNRQYNAIKKETYYLESDAVRSIKNRKTQFEELLQQQLFFTPAQAERTFESFRKHKESELDTIDFNESSYQQKQITAAVQFSQHIEGEQNRADFLERAGVCVSRRYDELVFTSAVKSSVQLSYGEICERTKGSAEPVSAASLPFDPYQIPEPTGNLSRISKAERQFFNAFVNHEDKRISGDFFATAAYLGREERAAEARRIFIPKEEVAESLKPLNGCFRSILREDGYKYQSDLMANLDNHKDRFMAVLLEKGCDELKAERIYSIYKDSVERKLPKTVEDEKEVAINRIIAASLFARNIENPADKSEFLMRMGLHAEVNRGVLTLSREDKRDYKITWEELIKREPKLSIEDQLFLQSVPSPRNADARLFNKKERDFVNTYIKDSWAKDVPDSRYSTAGKYLNEKEKAKATRLGNSARVMEILDRNPEASILNTVKALWSRGYVVKPFVENSGKSVFKVGMHNAKDDTYIALPFSIQQRLRDSHYINVYPSINHLVLNGKWNSPKMQTLKDITRAADYGDVDLLQSRIDKVAETNQILAKAMREAMGNPKKPDYERVANLVFNYQGEHTIILPPPTLAKNSFVKQQGSAQTKPTKETGYHDMLEAMKNGASLEYIEQKALERIRKREDEEQKNNGKSVD